MSQALFWALSGTPFSYLPYNTPSRLKIKAFPFPRAFTAKELLFQIIWQNRPPPAQYYIPPDAPKHAPSPNKPWKRVVVTLLVGSFSLFASLSICSQTFTTTYHMICIYQVIPGASQKNPDLVTNSGPLLALRSGSGPSPEFRTLLVPLMMEASPTADKTYRNSARDEVVVVHQSVCLVCAG